MAIAKTKPDSAIQTNVLPIGNRMLALEPRYVFDAAIATELHQLTTLDAPLDHSAEVPESVAATLIAAGNERAAIFEQRSISLETELMCSIENFVDAHNLAPTNHEIAFIDSRLADLSTLVNAIPEGTRIVLIDGSRDGVAQMADALRDEEGITGVHIVSHGSAGQIELGSSTLNADTMATVYRAALESIGSHLSADADILVYGCNFAAGSQGVVAVDLLSTITGADVAGSEDNTGSAQRGGDWDLEKQLGSIEAGLIDAPEWDGILAPFQISVSSLPALTGVTGISPTGFGSGGVGMTGVWTNAGTVGGVSVDLVAEVISATGGTQVSFWNQLDDPNVELFSTTSTAEAVIEWRVFKSGTAIPLSVATSGDVKFFITDIDGLGGSPFTIETVRADLTGLRNYTLETGSTIAISNDGSSVTGSGTQPFSAYSTIPSIRYEWRDVKTWQVTYREDNAITNGARYFRHDADGDLTFLAPILTGIPQLDLDGNNSAGISGKGYQTTYTENGAGVSVGDTDVSIEHDSSLVLTGATIKLTNPQGSDGLTVGTLPAGISSTTSTFGGVITVSLSGSATLANYQTAIREVTFSNTGDVPGAVDRFVTVRISDGVNQSDLALTTIHVVPSNDTPVAVPDSGAGIVGSAVTIDVAGNDLNDTDATDATDALELSSIHIAGAATPGASLVVSGEGTWSVNTSTGAITFTPIAGFTGTPTPISYTVADTMGARSVAAAVSVMPVHTTPHLDLSGQTPHVNAVGQTPVWGAFTYPHNGGYGSNPAWASAYGTTLFASVSPETGGPGLTLTNDGSSGYITGVSSTTLAASIAQGEYISMPFTTLGSIPDTWLQESALRFASGQFQFSLVISSDGFQSATLLSQDKTANAYAGPYYDGNSNYGLTAATDFKLQPGNSYELRAYIYNMPGGAGATGTWDDFYAIYSNDPTGHEATFNAGGAAVAIALPIAEVEDPNSANMASGMIVLTNKQASDRLVIGGTPVSNGSAGSVSGIGFTVIETVGTISIALTGNATKAAYAAFFSGVTFENMSSTPAVVDRVINATVSDGVETSNVATAIIHVNVAPEIAVSLGDKSGFDGNAVNIVTKGAFSDANADPLSFTATGLPAGLSIDPVSGKITGNLAANASISGPTSNGNYTIEVTATDPLGLTVSESFRFSAVNVAPTASNDSYSTNEDTAVTFNARSNDRDGGLDADALFVTQVGGVAITAGGLPVQVANGEVTLGSDGRLTFRPALDFNGTTTFSYTVSDGQGGSATASVLVDVIPVNDTPVATGNTGTVKEEGPLTDSGNVISDDDGFGADSDPDVEPLHVSNVNGTPVSGATSITGLYGTLVINPDGTYVYTLDNSNPTVQALQNGESLTENFGYTVSDPAPDLSANGSLEGTAPAVDRNTHNATLPPNWLLYQTPDVFNSATNFNGYTWALTPDGGDFLHGIGVGGYQEGFQQLLTGLVPGQQYTINFSQALSANGYGPSGDGHWQVSFGTQTQSAASMTTPALGTALPWQPQSLIFTATSTSENLLFIAVGNTGGNRVDLGIDGISIQAVAGTGLTAAANLAITINGTNDAPVAVNDEGQIGEDDASVGGNVITSAPGIDPDVDGDSLNVTSANQSGTAVTLGTPFTVSGGGELTLNADGSYIFEPGAAYNGLDANETATETITYTIDDGNGGTATAMLVITINGANDSPVVIDPANPVNIPGDPLYDPANPVGPADPLNIIPDISTEDGNPLASINAGNYIIDPDGEALTFTLGATTPSWVMIDPATGEITGTPPADASQGSNTGNAGEYLISITATDPNGALVTTTVTLTIVNLDPVANDDVAIAGEDTASVGGNVLTDPTTGDADTSPDSDPLSVTLADQNGTPLTIGAPFTVSGGGELTLNADGSYTFEPGAAYNGLDVGETATETITYTIDDGNGGTATAMLAITINGANDAPVVIDPANPVNIPGDPLYDPANPVGPANPLNIIPDVPAEDGHPLTPINVGSYVVDPDGEALTFTLGATTPSWVMIDPATGEITGTPPAAASQNSNTGNPGEYLITVTATDPDGALVTTTVTLTIVNLDPVALDDAASAGEDIMSISGNVLSDPTTGDADTSPDSDPITVTLAEQAGNAITIGTPFVMTGGGLLTLNADGSYTFEPGAAYNGLDAGETATETITYTIDDGNGGTSTAMLAITINGANDAPVVIDPANPGTAANPIEATGPLNIMPDVPGNDNQALTPINVGSYIVDPDGDALTFTLDPSVPSWLMIDPATGEITGTPPADASQNSNTGNPGEYLITITATDPDGALVTTTVTLTVINPAPIAADDTSSTAFNTPTVVDLLANDTDPDGDLLAVTMASVPAAQGTVVFDGTDWIFTPAEGFAGPATITYTIADRDGGTSTAIQTIEVAKPANPVAVNDNVSTSYLTALSGDAAAGDTYYAPGATFSAVSQPAHGTLVLNANGTYTYTPAANFSGVDTFTYLVTDAYGQSAMATEMISVAAPAIVAVDDAFTVVAGKPLNGNAAAQDTFAAGSTFAAVNNPQHGTVVMNANGTFVYRAAPLFSGTDTFTYSVTDLTGQTRNAVATIVVTLPPTKVVDHQLTAQANKPFVGNAGVGDVIPEGGVFAAASKPKHGSLVMGADGKYTYRPKPGFSGTDTFRYKVTLLDGRVITATERIKVEAPPQSHRCLTTFGQLNIRKR